MQAYSHRTSQQLLYVHICHHSNSFGSLPTITSCLLMLQKTRTEQLNSTQLDMMPFLHEISHIQHWCHPWNCVLQCKRTVGKSFWIHLYSLCRYYITNIHLQSNKKVKISLFVEGARYTFKTMALARQPHFARSVQPNLAKIALVTDQSW